VGIIHLVVVYWEVVQKELGKGLVQVWEDSGDGRVLRLRRVNPFVGRSFLLFSLFSEPLVVKSKIS
jgi:hypothetical protein